MAHATNLVSVSRMLRDGSIADLFDRGIARLLFPPIVLAILPAVSLAILLAVLFSILPTHTHDTSIV